MPLIAIW